MFYTPRGGKSGVWRAKSSVSYPAKRENSQNRARKWRKEPEEARGEQRNSEKRTKKARKEREEERETRVAE